MALRSFRFSKPPPRRFGKAALPSSSSRTRFSRRPTANNRPGPSPASAHPLTSASSPNPRRGELHEPITLSHQRFNALTVKRFNRLTHLTVRTSRFTFHSSEEPLLPSVRRSSDYELRFTHCALRITSSQLTSDLRSLTSDL